MLVSGGKILAIDKVNTNGTISGDGVLQPLGVDTDIIATKSNVSSVSSLLEQQIDAVSSNFEHYYKTEETSSRKELEDAFNGVIKHETVVSAQNVPGNIISVTSAIKEDGTVVFELSAKPEVSDTQIIGIDGIKAEQREDLAWVISYTGKSGNIYSAATPNLNIYEDANHQWWISAATYPDVSKFLTSAEGHADEALVLKNNQWVPADDVFATDEDIRNLSATVANTYLSASEFNTYSAGVDTRIDTLEKIAEQYTTTDSAHFETTYETVLNTSSVWNEVSAFSALSGNFMQTSKLASTDDGKLSGYGGSAFYYPPVPEYSGGEGIKVENYIISVSAEYLSANALNDISGAWNSVVDTVSSYSANWNDAVDTVSSNSAYWNEVSAFSAASGKFVTSASEELADKNLVLKNNQWTELVEKDWTEEIAAASAAAVLSAVETVDNKFDLTEDDEISGYNNIPFYHQSLEDYYKKDEIDTLLDNTSAWANETFQPIGDYLSANALDDISGAWDSVFDTVSSNSAMWGEITAYSSNSGKYVTSALTAFRQGLSYFLTRNVNNVSWSGVDLADIVAGEPAYASYTASMTADDGTYTPDTYSEAYNVGTGIVLEDGELSVAPGLWHVTIYAKVTNADTSTDYYDTTLNCKTVNKKNIVQFDNSYIHTEYINLDTDINNATLDNLQIEIELTNVPANSVVELEQLQIHKIVTGNVDSEGGVYLPGYATTIDNYHINVQAGSGIYVDSNNKLSIKLGKGLAFSADGDVVAIETNTEVNDVIDTVENLKNELDGKLTTNMNISDAKDAGCPWDGDTTNINNIAASFFTIPLQHNLTSASEISFFATQGLGQSDADPLVIGILEYNFDYFEADAEAPNGVKTRSQTQWIADTGPIWYDTLDVNNHALTAGAGRYTYKLKNVTVGSASDVTGTDGTVYHNEFGPSLRSDRAYYLALYTYSPNSYKYFLCDNGYANGINNTDPAISFRKTGTTYTDADGVVRSISRDVLALVKSQNLPFSMSGMEYWDRHTNDTNNMKRPYVMIRNPRL